MPLSGLDLLLFLGVVVAVILAFMWRRAAGWWALAALIAFIIVGNAVEQVF